MALYIDLHKTGTDCIQGRPLRKLKETRIADLDTRGGGTLKYLSECLQGSALSPWSLLWRDQGTSKEFVGRLLLTTVGRTEEPTTKAQVCTLHEAIWQPCTPRMKNHPPTSGTALYAKHTP
jgi:hypothetical protein